MKGLIKMAKKIYTKKLTYAGMSLCLLSFFAFILSAAGALADPVGKLVYNNVFTNKIDFLFTPDIFAYVTPMVFHAHSPYSALWRFSHLQEQRARKSLMVHSQAFLSFSRLL